MEFKNKFSWSYSRKKLFERCRREYYLSKYCSWGGWDYQADDRAKLCYRLSKMTNLDMWAGTLVHDAIAGIIHRLPERSSVEQIQDEVVQRMRIDWRKSLAKKWKARPKDVPLFHELYYGLELNRARTDAIKAKVLLSLENFLNSKIYDLLLGRNPKDFKSIEKLESFELEGFKIWIMIDFADAQGPLVIYDWKTGKVREEDKEQLSIYALYAITEWGFLPEEITVKSFYLSDGHLSSFVYTPEEIEQTKHLIKTSCGEMTAVVNEKNEAKEEDFPKTQNEWKCKRCAFYEVCYNSREID